MCLFMGQHQKSTQILRLQFTLFAIKQTAKRNSLIISIFNHDTLDIVPNDNLGLLE